MTAVADVRSSPYSRFTPQFNRERFADALKADGIKYAYLGNELGGVLKIVPVTGMDEFAIAVLRRQNRSRPVWIVSLTAPRSSGSR